MNVVDDCEKSSSNTSANNSARQPAASRQEIKTVEKEKSFFQKAFPAVIGLLVLLLALVLGGTYWTFRQSQGLKVLARRQQDNLSALAEIYRSQVNRLEEERENVRLGQSPSVEDLNIRDEQRQLVEETAASCRQGEKIVRRLASNNSAFIDQAHSLATDWFYGDQFGELITTTDAHTKRLTGLLYFYRKSNQLVLDYLLVVEDFFLAVEQADYGSLDEATTDKIEDKLTRLESLTAQYRQVYELHPVPAEMEKFYRRNREAMVEVNTRAQVIYDYLQAGNKGEMEAESQRLYLAAEQLTSFAKEDVLSFWRSGKTVSQTDSLITRWHEAEQTITAAIPLYSFWEKVLGASS